jgi:hypothetical protein
MGPWYVAYLRGRDTVMHIADDRGGAIDKACEMLRQGINVTQVGPMSEAPGTRIDTTSIREICEARQNPGAGAVAG